MARLLRVKKVGVFGSLQDQGRFGYRNYGIPTSGPMDATSYQLGNEILQNDTNAVALEIFIGGFCFEALTTQSHVMTGAPAICLLNGEPIAMWVTFTLYAGDELTIKTVQQGSIVYLHTIGGFEAPLTLGSRSAYEKGNIGLPITRGMVLTSQICRKIEPRRGIWGKALPNFSCKKVRIYPGVHYELFTTTSREALLTTSYQYTGGNRMGYYFSGEMLTLASPREILSESTQFGTIQVPASGKPIILMADAQTVGGYPIIATVHEADLAIVAQLKTYESLQFEWVKE